jgi:hypothetical protein
MGIVYEIVNSAGSRYIGSTMATLEERLYYHIRDFIRPHKNTCLSLRVFQEEGCYKTCQFNVLGNYPDCTREELLKHETLAIVSRQCVNATLPSNKIPLFKS